jgi:hypothetical protein
MDTFIYDDEILPELEIEELMTLEDMLQHQPSFVAFTKDEIHILMQHLLGSSAKADTFSKMHSKLLDPTAPEDDKMASHVVVGVGAKRVHVGDDGDLAFFEDLARAKDAPNYTLQQMGVHRVMLPFEQSPDTPNGIDLEQQRMAIRLEDGSQSVLLPEDPIIVKASSAQWQVKPVSVADYSGETDMGLSLRRSTPVVAWEPSAPNDLTTWVSKFVRPTFASIMEEIPDSYTLHDIHRVLSRFGYDLNALTKEEMSLLHQRLMSIPYPDDITEEDSIPTEKLTILKPDGAALDFIESLTQVAARMPSLVNDAEKQRIEDMYAAFLQSAPPMPSDISLLDPYDIVKRLQDGSLQLDDVVTHLQQWYQRWNMDVIARYVEKYRETSGNNVNSEYGDAMRKRMGVMQGSQSRQGGFVSIYRDLSEVKEGTNTAMYDGIMRNVYHHDGGVIIDEFEIVPDTGVQNVDDDDVIMPDEFAYDVPLPTECCNGLSDGAHEVLGCAWTRLHRTQQASGLPGNLPFYLEAVKARVAYPSRLSKVRGLFPVLSSDVISAFLVSDLNLALSRISDMSMDSGLQQELLAEFPRIHREWEEACWTAFVAMLVMWSLDLLGRAIDGSLEFSTSTAMIQHIGLWSPFGPPVENTRTGIIPYLTAVVSSLYPSMAADTLQQAMLEVCASMHSDRIQQLRDAWEEADKVQTRDRAAHAKTSLVNAIAAIKAKQRVNIVPAYIQAMLYLPTMLPARKNAAKVQRWVQGCCATKLDESFEADKDWKDQWKDMYMIKQGLSRKRWSQDPRAPLRSFMSTTEKGDAPTKAEGTSILHRPVVKDDDAPTHQTQVTTMLMQQEWVPRTHMDMLLRKPMETNEWAKVVLGKVFGRTKLPVVLQTLGVLNSNSNLMMSYINRVATILPVSMGATMRSWLAPMKDLVRTLGNGNDVKYVLTYCFTWVSVLPSSMSQSTDIINPSGLTVQETGTIHEAIYKICVEFTKSGAALTNAEIQHYITKKREQQKQVSLAKMDVLSAQDRKILQDSKKLKLVKLTEATELKDTSEMEALFEFRVRSQDHDESNPDVLGD